MLLVLLIKLSFLIYCYLFSSIFIENILGLQVASNAHQAQLHGVIQLLIEIRKDAKSRKDFATSDKIRNQLIAMGIQIKDEKDGQVSYSLV